MGYADKISPNASQENAKTGRLVLVRHGESEWNKTKTFTGWVDVDLTKKGIEGARSAGQQLKDAKFIPDIVYSTKLSRAYKTAKEMLEVMGTPKAIVERNEMIERHYGDLTGKNKVQVEEELMAKAIHSAAEKKGDKLSIDEIISGIQAGKKQFLGYRRSYGNPPPVMDESNPHHPENTSSNKPKIVMVSGNDSKTESLKDVVARVKPFWEKELLPKLQKGENIMISAHGNSLRALSMIVQGMSEEKVVDYEIENTKPVVFDIKSKENSKEWTFKEVDITKPVGRRK